MPDKFNFVSRWERPSRWQLMAVVVALSLIPVLLGVMLGVLVSLAFLA